MFSYYYTAVVKKIRIFLVETPVSNFFFVFLFFLSEKLNSWYNKIFYAQKNYIEI